MEGEYADDEGGGDLLFFALLIAGAYFGARWYRDNIAAAAGAGIFPSSAPSSDPVQGALAYLVPLSLSPTGEQFIRGKEGFSAYPNASGDIGIGHHVQPGEHFTYPLSQAEGERLFASDTAGAERAVSDGLQVEVSQSQFDALVDFAFNEGRSAFLGSTLLRVLNSGDYAGASQQFSRWVYANGQISPALEARRGAEQNLFQFG